MSLLNSVFNNKFNIMKFKDIAEKTGFPIEEIRKKARMYGIFEHRLTQEKIEILMKQYKDGYVLISSKMNFI